MRPLWSRRLCPNRQMIDIEVMPDPVEVVEKPHNPEEELDMILRGLQPDQ